MRNELIFIGVRIGKGKGGGGMVELSNNWAID